MKKFTAILNKMDNDYRTHVGDISVEVDDWAEGEYIAEDKTWSGHTYFLDFLIDNTTQKRVRSEKEYKEVYGSH